MPYTSLFGYVNTGNSLDSQVSALEHRTAINMPITSKGNLITEDNTSTICGSSKVVAHTFFQPMN